MVFGRCQSKGMAQKLLEHGEVPVRFLAFGLPVKVSS
jgi:hypothetical protein